MSFLVSRIREFRIRVRGVIRNRVLAFIACLLPRARPSRRPPVVPAARRRSPRRRPGCRSPPNGGPALCARCGRPTTLSTCLWSSTRSGCSWNIPPATTTKTRDDPATFAHRRVRPRNARYGHSKSRQLSVSAVDECAKTDKGRGNVMGRPILNTRLSFSLYVTLEITTWRSLLGKFFNRFPTSLLNVFDDLSDMIKDNDLRANENSMRYCISPREKFIVTYSGARVPYDRTLDTSGPRGQCTPRGIGRRAFCPTDDHVP